LRNEDTEQELILKTDSEEASYLTATVTVRMDILKTLLLTVVTIIKVGIKFMFSQDHNTL